jgi:hypothetical protein
MMCSSPAHIHNKSKRKEKGRWNKCRQAHMVSSQCNMGRGTKRPLYHYPGDSFQCLQPDDLMIEVHTKQKWKKLSDIISLVCSWWTKMF